MSDIQDQIDSIVSKMKKKESELAELKGQYKTLQTSIDKQIERCKQLGIDPSQLKEKLDQFREKCEAKIAETNKQLDTIGKAVPDNSEVSLEL